MEIVVLIKCNSSIMIIYVYMYDLPWKTCGRTLLIEQEGFLVVEGFATAAPRILITFGCVVVVFS